MLDCKSKERSGGMEIQRQKKAALNWLNPSGIA